MSDIVDGLRGRADRYRQLWGNAAYYTEGDALFDEKAAARIEQLEAALRPLACTCTSKHPDGCSSGEVDCPFWNARVALAAF